VNEALTPPPRREHRRDRRRALSLQGTVRNYLDGDPSSAQNRVEAAHIMAKGLALERRRWCGAHSAQISLDYQTRRSL
jgi:hypothetical protein